MSALGVVHGSAVAYTAVTLKARARGISNSTQAPMLQALPRLRPTSVSLLLWGIYEVFLRFWSRWLLYHTRFRPPITVAAIR